MLDVLERLVREATDGAIKLLTAQLAPPARCLVSMSERYYCSKDLKWPSAGSPTSNEQVDLSS